MGRVVGEQVRMLGVPRYFSMMAGSMNALEIERVRVRVGVGIRVGVGVGVGVGVRVVLGASEERHA